MRRHVSVTLGIGAASLGRTRFPRNAFGSNGGSTDRGSHVYVLGLILAIELLLDGSALFHRSGQGGSQRSHTRERRLRRGSPARRAESRSRIDCTDGRTAGRRGRGSRAERGAGRAQRPRTRFPRNGCADWLRRRWPHRPGRGQRRGGRSGGSGFGLPGASERRQGRRIARRGPRTRFRLTKLPVVQRLLNRRPLRVKMNSVNEMIMTRTHRGLLDRTRFPRSDRQARRGIGRNDCTPAANAGSVDPSAGRGAGD